MAEGCPDIPYPPHAYVPGKTPRHPENRFDSIKGSVLLSMGPEALVSCAAYRVGAAYFHSGFYWECHEVLEAVWMALPDGADRAHVQAVIQLANARLKLKMGKPRAARRLCDIVEGLLSQASGAIPVPGLTRDTLKSILQSTRCLAMDTDNAQDNA